MAINRDELCFPERNKSYNQVFRPGQMSIGLVVPIEGYGHAPTPTMQDQLALIQYVEELGFAAVWLRDVPFHVPSFGDVGQIFDPFVYLGLLAGQTKRIALGTASVILPLRHPAHVAKAAASVDVLSGGRMLLGVASGDRPTEYPAMAMSFPDRGKRFRESYAYIRQMSASFPTFQNGYGDLTGIDMLPKPVGTDQRLPMLITGGSQQSPEWIAQYGDGWMLYPRQPEVQRRIISNWRQDIREYSQWSKPAMQPLYVDLLHAPDAPVEPIHLGFRAGIHAIRQYLQDIEAAGVNHVALNLRFQQGDIKQALNTLAKELFPSFSSIHQQSIDTQ